MGSLHNASRLIRGLFALGLFAVMAGPAESAEVTQFFPLDANGQPPLKPESGWRIKFSILPAPAQNLCIDNKNDYGCADIWEIQSAEFLRGGDPGHEGNWLKILNKLALTEMYVVYNDGNEIWDIHNNKSVFRPLTAEDVAGPGVISRTFYEGNIVVGEVIDDHVRWAPPEVTKVRRGQALVLWATLFAGNYRYILRYTFVDDGTIRVAVGATGHDFRNAPVLSDGQSAQERNEAQNGIHIHAPVWRLEFDLGDAAANKIEIVERQAEPATTVARIHHRPYNSGREGGMAWDPDTFSSVMITSKTLSRHKEDEPPVSYMLISPQFGRLRNSFAQTESDYWVTRLTPSTARRLGKKELSYYFLLDNLGQDKEPIDNHAVAIWHSVPFQHIPRTEDFGGVGYKAYDGLAETMWSGFDLMPHNLWPKTPFYEQ